MKKNSTVSVDNFDNHPNIVGLSKLELVQAIESLGEKSFRAKQLWHWVFNRGETDFYKMTTIAKDFREKLKNNFVIERPKVVSEQVSEDRTHKWLVEFKDGAKVECVYIPEEDRGAFCLSTQAGCQAGCRFCNTGSQTFFRNLEVDEIVGQFMLARDFYGEWPTPVNETRYISNVVVMGMGEPLLNYDNTVKALKIIMDPEGISLSKRKITLSTCGIVPNIRRAAEDLGVKLAVSLHASNDETRNKIMPINKKYPIAELMQACHDYQEIAGNRQYITFEYVMLDDVNDTDEDAKRLIALIKEYDLGAKFNLIPFNPWVGCDFACSSAKKIKKFAEILEKAGFSTPVRVSRGQDISAACGQLRAAEQKKGN